MTAVGGHMAALLLHTPSQPQRPAAELLDALDPFLAPSPTSICICWHLAGAGIPKLDKSFLRGSDPDGGSDRPDAPDSVDAGFVSAAGGGGSARAENWEDADGLNWEVQWGYRFSGGWNTMPTTGQSEVTRDAGGRWLARVGGLRPGTKYVARVRAWTVAGTGASAAKSLDTRVLLSVLLATPPLPSAGDPTPFPPILLPCPPMWEWNSADQVHQHVQLKCGAAD